MLVLWNKARPAVSPAIIMAIAIVVALALVGAALGYTYASSGGPGNSPSTVQSTSWSGLTTTSSEALASNSLSGSSSTSQEQTTVTSTVTVTVSGTGSGNGTSSSTVETTQIASSPSASIVQSCASFGNPNEFASCELPNEVTSGDLLVVAVAEFSGTNTSACVTSTKETQPRSANSTGDFTLTDSLGDLFAMVGEGPGQPGNTYTFYYFAANASSTGTDQVRLTGLGSFPFIFVHEVKKGDTHIAGFSCGAGTSAATWVSPSYTVPAGSLTIATLWVQNDDGVAAVTVGAGAGYALLDDAYAVTEEYGTITLPGNSTCPFALSGSIPWGEIALSLD